MEFFNNHKEEPYSTMFRSFVGGKCLKKSRFVKIVEAILELDMSLELKRKSIMLHNEDLIEKFTRIFCTLEKSKYGSQSTKLLSHVKSLVIIVAKIIICFYLTIRKNMIKYSNHVPTSSIPRDYSLATRPWTLVHLWKY